MKKVYKDNVEMMYNDAPGALEALKACGWSEKKPAKKAEKKPTKKAK